MLRSADTARFRLIDLGRSVLPDGLEVEVLAKISLRPIADDIGAFVTTNDPFDVGGFKTPSVRNAGLKRRLFHNGQSVALDDPAQLTDPTSTLNIYLQGGGVDPSNLDPFMLPLINLGVTANDLVVIQDFVITADKPIGVAQILPSSQEIVSIPRLPTAGCKMLCVRNMGLNFLPHVFFFAGMK